MPFVRTNAPAAPGRFEADVLRVQIEQGEPAQRRAAARALGGTPGAAIVLLQALAGETEREVQSALLAALSQDAGPAAVAGLAECLRSEDAWLRNAAIDLLRGMPERAAPVVHALLSDPDRDVRILAVGIADAFEAAQAEAWLLALIEAEADVNVCGAALEVLAQSCSAAAAPAVTRLRARFAGEPFIDFACALVLRRAGA